MNPSTNDVDALAEGERRDLSRFLQGSPGLFAAIEHILAQHTAAAEARGAEKALQAFADEHERIARAIEALETFAHGGNPTSKGHVIGFGVARKQAAAIARAGGR